jgi:hypothetical protein
MKTQKGVEVYLYSFFKLEARCVSGKATPLLLYFPDRGPVPIVQADGWAGLDGRGYIAANGIRSQGRPARRESLYQLLYPDPLTGK